MKTYPFLKVLIKLYWLVLFILLGLLISPLFNYFLSKEANKTVLLTIGANFDKSAISPEISPEISLGKKLFRTKCGSCHNKNMKSPMIGPALAGVRERWSDYPITDLYDWVRNSYRLVESGHPKAIEVYKANDKASMTPFPKMEDKEIEAILAYIAYVD